MADEMQTAMDRATTTEPNEPPAVEGNAVANPDPSGAHEPRARSGVEGAASMSRSLNLPWCVEHDGDDIRIVDSQGNIRVSLDGANTSEAGFGSTAEHIAAVVNAASDPAVSPASAIMAPPLVMKQPDLKVQNTLEEAMDLAKKRNDPIQIGADFKPHTAVDNKKPYMPIGDCPLVFVDVETTGLEPGFHEIVEICCVRDLRPGEHAFVDAHPDVPGAPKDPVPGLAIFWRRIQPERLNIADPSAMSFNGYTPEKWAKALPVEAHLEAIGEFLEDGVMCAHNVPIDKGFIEHTFQRYSLPFKWDYRHIETYTLVYEHLVPAGLTGISLGKTCTALGISNEGAHTALSDTLRLKAVFERLIRATWLDRMWWRIKIAWQELQFRRKRSAKKRVQSKHIDKTLELAEELREILDDPVHHEILNDIFAELEKTR